MPSDQQGTSHKKIEKQSDIMRSVYKYKTTKKSQILQRALGFHNQKIHIRMNTGNLTRYLRLQNQIHVSCTNNFFPLFTSPSETM